jgi:hypothetical protein
MSLVHNERTKLTATWVSGLATAFIAAGLFAPLAALVYGIADLRIERLSMTTIAIGCVAIGVLLHSMGRLLLRRLIE